MNTIAIIGTSGRNGEKLNKEIMDTQLAYLNKIIDQEIEDGNEIMLVSGGSAWMDHLAVLFHINRNIPLTLYLPCKFVDGKFNSSTEGKRLNQLHEKYKKETGEDSLAQLDLAINTIPTCDVKIIDGFKQRNTHIAKSDRIYAFAYQFESGGTADTIKKAKNEVIRVQL